MSTNKPEALTAPEDWNSFYDSRELRKTRIPSYVKFILDEDIWSNTPGKIFELGCGASPLLAKSAILGWEIAGIDFNKKAIELLRTFLTKEGLQTGILIHGNILTYDCRLLENKYDVLISSGFLEHFKSPSDVLRKWSQVLKQKGKVISFVPNLVSFNAKLLKIYDIDLYNKHIVILPHQLDRIHLDAGLSVKKSAIYTGGYDALMLIPWAKIREKINSLIVFKLLQYFSFHIVAKCLELLLPYNNAKIWNPIIYGVYEKP